MKTPNDEGLDRRAMFGLVAATAAAGVSALAPGQAASQPTPGAAARGPGIPVPSPVVHTQAGEVQGLVEDGVLAFKGIRYGAAPIGDQRFMPPKPAAGAVSPTATRLRSDAVSPNPTGSRP